MYSKLAIKNVRKSVKDYTIYFLTLTISVCIFYVFNSIADQSIMLELNQNQRGYVKLLSNVISGASVFIAFVLGFLIIYANGFLIKRRKKELGLYMCLGMGKGKVSSILFLETFVIGITSLAVGIIIGVFLSQGLAIITANLFAVNMTRFTFVFSSSSMIKTILYFGIMFVLVMFFNSVNVSRYKLIDLIYGEKKNQELKTKNIYVSVVIFLLSVACLVTAYLLILHNKLFVIDEEFIFSLILGFLGTMLFFMSLSGFLLKIVQSNKKLYFKNLNMFVLRQINSKINTTFVSMGTICLMLFVTIGMLATGFSINRSINQSVYKITPYDVSISMQGLDKQTVLNELGMDISKTAKKSVEYQLYEAPFGFLSMTGDTDNPDLKQQIEQSITIEDFNPPVMTISDYNKLMEGAGRDTIHADGEHYYLVGNYQMTFPLLQEFIDRGRTLTFGGTEYTAGQDKAIDESYETTPMALNMITILVPDSAIQNAGLQPVAQGICFDLKDGIIGETFEERFDEASKKVFNKYNFQDKNDLTYFQMYTKEETRMQSAGLSTMVVYMGIYIGLVFLITSVAVLAIQQLSEAADNAKRYRILRNIGAESKMLNHALCLQILIYFLMPLFLAVIHSIVGLYVANTVVVIFGASNIVLPAILTTLVLLAVYGIYFLATYFGSKNIINRG